MPARDWLLCPLLWLGTLAAAHGQQTLVTEAADVRLPAGFVAERLYVVPQETEGSWVCLTQAGEGRPDSYLPVELKTVQSSQPDWEPRRQ